MKFLREIRRGWQARRGTRRFPLMLTIAMSLSMSWAVVESDVPLALSVAVVAIWPATYIVGLWDQGSTARWDDFYKGLRSDEPW